MATKKCWNMQINKFSNLFDKNKRGEALRFILAGTSATLLQYAVYLLCLWLIDKAKWRAPAPEIQAAIALTIGYLVSFTYNYFVSSYYTFRVGIGIKRGLGFAFAHLVNFLLQNMLLQGFLWVGIGRETAIIPVFFICVPVNFVLVRFFLKK